MTTNRRVMFLTGGSRGIGAGVVLRPRRPRATTWRSPTANAATRPTP